LSGNEETIKNLNETLKVKDLDVVLNCLSFHQFSNSQWQDLGLQLGLYMPTLNDIKNDCVGHSEQSRECLRKCLTAWLEGKDKVLNKGGPSWTLLADALDVIREKNIAESIRKYYIM
jgi:hypothetical protein